MKYRPHRGSLAKSLRDQVEVADKEALLELVRDHLGEFFDKSKITDETVKVEFYCYDERIKENSHIVTLDGYGVLGFTNGPMPHS